MRAVFLEGLRSQETYSITGEILHHLVQVIRLEKNEELLLLNGKGLSVKTIVLEASKRELKLQMISEQNSTRNFTYDLVLGIPKKEALELSLKEAVELGFRKIFLVRSAYSQLRVPEAERINNLLVSALEQSNCPFLPEVVEVSWNEISWNDYGTVLLLDSQQEKSHFSDTISTTNLLIVGPEGGFSPEELISLRSQSGVESVLLPTPILRTPTAVATGAGLILQRLMT